MATRISKRSVKIVSRLIMQEFNKCEFWQYEKQQKLITVAKEYGLNKLHKKLKKKINE